ncbi:hypothetical protein IGI37_003103 [Enterococcus sp. AZ194]
MGYILIFLLTIFIMTGFIVYFAIEKANKYNKQMRNLLEIIIIALTKRWEELLHRIILQKYII